MMIAFKPSTYITCNKQFIISRSTIELISSNNLHVNEVIIFTLLYLLKCLYSTDSAFVIYAKTNYYVVIVYFLS